MKPTVGRIIHTRIDGIIVGGVITEVEPDAGDTRNAPVHISEIEVLGHRYGSGGNFRFQCGCLLYDTEQDVVPNTERAWFWPERV